MKFAKIKNNFGNEFTVPVWKAKEMIVNGEIEGYETVEVEDHYMNVDKPQTQAEFERALK